MTLSSKLLLISRWDGCDQGNLEPSGPFACVCCARLGHAFPRWCHIFFWSMVNHVYHLDPICPQGRANEDSPGLIHTLAQISGWDLPQPFILFHHKMSPGHYTNMTNGSSLRQRGRHQRQPGKGYREILVKGAGGHCHKCGDHLFQPL